MNSNPQIKAFIIKSLHEVVTNSPGRRINRLIDGFVSASNWPGVERALFDSTKAGGASEQLVAISFMPFLVVPSRSAVRIVTGSSLEAVHTKLSSLGTRGLPPPELLVPSQILTATPTVQVEEGEKVTEAEGPIVVASAPVAEQVDRSQTTTAAEEEAARSLYRLWNVRRDVRRRNEVVVGINREAINSAFVQYQSVAPKESSLQRRRILGLLPHLLVALQSTQARLLEMRKKLQAEFKTAEGERLELVHDLIPQRKYVGSIILLQGRSLTRFCREKKQVTELIKMISPTPTFDPSLSLDSLVPLVATLLEDTEKYFNASDPTKGLDVATLENFRLFSRGMEERKMRVPLPVEKPALNMAEDYEDEGDPEEEDAAEEAGRRIAAGRR